MFSGKDAANPAYPTQWALNPTAYQNVDSSTVDWAALAQQWIAMKEAAAIIAAPPPPSMKPDTEEGEAPMEVENPEVNHEGSAAPPGAEWNAATNSWTGGWNQWGWGGWSDQGDMDAKMGADPSLSIPGLMDGFPVTGDGNTQMPGYTTGPAPTFQHGYWTAPQEQTNSRGSSRSRDRRSKSKNRDRKSSRTRSHRDKPSIVPPVMEPMVMPTPTVTSTIDAAKRRQLPGWIREGLEKMEREKQRAIEREQELKAREEAEKEKKRLEEEELKRMKAEVDGEPIMPAKSKFETDSEGESEKEDKPELAAVVRDLSPEREVQVKAEPAPPLVKRSREEIMQEVMLTVRRSLTEILLEVTDQEIHTVSQEELARYTAAQASRLNAMKASKSKALAAIASGLGLGAYESSSEESADEDDQRDITDQQLQDIIKRKKSDFERTSREIEAEVRRAELREAGEDPSTPVATPERPRRSRSSATPPPVDSDTPEKIPERRLSKDKRNNVKSNDKIDGVRKLDVIHEEKPKKSSKRERTPTPPKSNNKGNQKESTETTSSDSEADSSSSSSQQSSESEREVKVETKAKKRKRRSSSSSNSQKKSKKEKHKKEKSHKSDERNSVKSRHHDDYDKSRSRKKDDYYERHKSSRSRDYEKSHKDKYREESDDDRPRKRSKRSRSVTSYESRSARKRSTRDRSEERRRSHRDRSYDRSGRDRDHDKHDRYERSRDYDRRRSRSGSRSRHRR